MTGADSHAGRRRLRDRGDGGQATIWVLALCIMLLAFGGISLDLWRAFSAWRALAATADAGAAAGASGIDEATFRATGGATVQLDPTVAEQRAYESLAAQQDDSEIARYQAHATTSEITVIVEGRVGFTLLRILPGDDAIAMTVSATADPRPSD
jgi:Flp pilus assembly protein TadG